MLKDRTEGSLSPGLGAEACCAGCQTRITDRFYLLAVDRQWHLGCLQCSECKIPLDTELTCFARHGNIYCKDDYFRLFAVKRCSRCQAGISASELVMRARDAVYHLHCFSCASCGVLLTKGDYFGMRDGLVYCRPHYELLRHRDYCSSIELEALSPAHWAASTVHKGRPRKRKLMSSPSPSHESIGTELAVNMRIPGTLEMMHSGDLSSSMESLTYDSSVTSPGLQSSQQRTKRMRTSFKHHQLRTMKSYFNINQNPDAKDLKQLAQKTGLSKRVLQVWFQNARAKWRRNLMRQESGQSSVVQGSQGTGTGPPSVGPSSIILGDSNSLDDHHLHHHHHVQASQALGFSEIY